MNRRHFIKAAGAALVACVPALVLAKTPDARPMKAPVKQEPPVFAPPKGKSWFCRPYYQVAEELNRQAHLGRTDWRFNSNSYTDCMCSFETWGPVNENTRYSLILSQSQLSETLHRWDKDQGNESYAR